MEITFMLWLHQIASVVVFAVVINTSIIVKIFKWQFEYKRDFHLFLFTSHYRASKPETALNCWFTVLSARSSNQHFMSSVSSEWRRFTLITFIVKFPKNASIQWTPKSKFQLNQRQINPPKKRAAKQFSIEHLNGLIVSPSCEASKA